MDTVRDGSIDELISLENVIKLLYVLGLTSVTVWEEKLNLIKKKIIGCNNFDVLTVYIKLTDLSKQMQYALELKYANSQRDLPLIANYCFTIEDIYEYLNTHIENFTHCTITKSSFIIIKTFITETIDNNVESIDIDDDNNNNIDDVEFDKIFNSVQSNKKDENELFEQTAMFNANGDKKKLLKTPGEKGKYLLKIEIADTSDLIGVDSSKRWLQTAYKAIFLTDTKDHNYMTLYKMILNVSRNLSKVKNVTKQTYTKK